MELSALCKCIQIVFEEVLKNILDAYVPCEHLSLLIFFLIKNILN